MIIISEFTNGLYLLISSIYSLLNTGVYRQPSTRLQNSTPKLAGQNPESISHEAIYHGTLAIRTFSRYQVFEKLLWKPSEDVSQRSSWNQMSLTI